MLSSRPHPSALPLQQNERCDEEAAPGSGHEDDGMAVGAAGNGRSGGGIVTALCAALREGRYGTEDSEEQARRERYPPHWKKVSRTNRKIQNRPMECQYQEAQSIMIWRLSSERETYSPMSAAMRPKTPKTRWMPWTPVIR